ncbi:isobutyryl-CoA dehydrogenase [Rhizoclosmatium globosum]|uniref:Isobutyryl-CoA dehydrogenase, mitochondrial n=1 Tax=Rhizoclosmatium globosum TaxID=329046 RepID=A0A1Y2CCX1_9FUNG|nr:isobutyryl-CoA dehydrogenase [Rhizoclosmatium globosum]|eukprot:ORY44888.1 isobutyryl-CoA dehydrogenase [Rhizoclosmatium globosum]
MFAGRHVLRRSTSRAILSTAVPKRGLLSAVVNPKDGLSDEECEIYDLAKRFADSELAPNMRKWDESSHFPIETMRKAAELGFGTIYCSEEYGGTGLKRIDASIIFEALSGGDVPVTAFISIHNMVAWMIDSFGSKELKEKYIPKLSSMEILASYCLTEPSSGSDAASLQTTAKRDGDYLVLNGSKAFISGAGSSDLYLVMVRTGGPGAKGITSVLVEKGTPGFSFGKNEDKIGWKCQPTRVITFEDCRVPITNIVGEEGKGFTYAMKGLNGGRVNIASCSLGGAQSALQAAVDHVGVRNQFGNPLSSFQNTQFKLAEMAMKLTASRLMVRNAARAVDAQSPSAAAACAMAKAFATEECFKVTDEAIQLHGGYGYLNDYPVGQYMRDLRVNRILEGTSEVMRMIVAREIIKE